MMYNSVDLHSEFFWLFIAATGTGLAFGTLVRALFSRRGGGRTGERWRVAQSSVQVSLYLSLAAGGVLGGLLSTDAAEVPWAALHLNYFLAVVTAFLVLRVFLRYLWLPAVLLSLIMVIAVSILTAEWDCLEDGQELMQVRLLSAADNIKRLEIDLRGESDVFFRRIEGAPPVYRFEVLSLPEWSFHPRCGRLFRFDEVYAAGDAPVPSESSLVVKFFRTAGIAEYDVRVIEQRNMKVLQPYRFFYDEDKDSIFIQS